jgi:hypothetical protein
MEGPADWSTLIFIGGILGAALAFALTGIAAAWSIRGSIEAAKNELKTLIDGSDATARLAREAIGERVNEMQRDLVKAISDSRHDLRSEVNARLLGLEVSFDKLHLEFVEHRTEDRGYFENLQMRVAHLEPPPAAPIIRRTRP